MEPKSDETEAWRPSSKFVLWISFGSLVYAFLRLWGTVPLSDERHHFAQAVAIAAGEWTPHPSITTLPVWHWFASIVVGSPPEASLAAARFLNLAAAGGALFVFSYFIRAIAPEKAGWRTLQLAVFPLFLPYAALVYTDIPSLIPALLCLLCAHRGRDWMAGGFGVIAILIRQTNVITVLAAALLAFLHFRRHPEARGVRTNWTRPLPYFLPVGCFAVFGVLNGGVTVGEQHMHILGDVYLGNPTLTVASLPLLFAPAFVAACIRGEGPQPQAPLVFVLLVTCGLVLGFLWMNEHPWNQAEYGYFLHNRVLLWSSSGWLPRLVYGGMIGLGLFLLFRWRFDQGPWGWVFALMVLALISAPLIEPRYALLPLVLAQGIRPSLSSRGEGGLFVFWLGVSVLLLEGMAEGKFFP